MAFSLARLLLFIQKVIQVQQLSKVGLSVLTRLENPAYKNTMPLLSSKTRLTVNSMMVIIEEFAVLILECSNFCL